MIGVIDVEIQAANPQMPLYPLRAFVNSPSSVRVRNVPTDIGAWKITSVRVAVAYPDSSIKTADCVLAGGAWVATVTGCAVSGTTENGFTVFAGGVDENGNAVANYVLGKGNVEVLKADGTLSPDAQAYYVHLLEEEPDAPNEGDMWPTAAGFVIWQDGEAHALGGGSSVSVVPPSPSAQTGQAADAKATGDALWTGFTEWVCDSISEGYEFVKCEWVKEQGMSDYAWKVSFVSTSSPLPLPLAVVIADSTHDAVSLSLADSTLSFSISRHLITPTKTSQLTNDGDGTNAFVKTNDTRLSDARTPTAHHATHAANGSDPITPADIGAAAATDLPYALVEPGVWEFSGSAIDSLNPRIAWEEDKWVLTVYGGGSDVSVDGSGDAYALSVDFYVELLQETITATRPSLPGHLLDRAGNRVVVSGDTTLTLPAAVPGYLRDFLVRLEISGSTVPTITFAAPTGETITYETDGDEFPVPDEAGDWLYSFTESCVAHMFAVSLKKVNTVAAPQAQGGS